MHLEPLSSRLHAAEIPPERLAQSKAVSERDKLLEASRQFEAILLRQIFDASQKTVIGSEAENSASSSIYRDLVTQQLAEAISKSGALGLARTFEAQLTRQGAAQAVPPAGAEPQPAPAPASNLPGLHAPKHPTRLS